MKSQTPQTSTKVSLFWQVQLADWQVLLVNKQPLVTRKAKPCEIVSYFLCERLAFSLPVWDTFRHLRQKKTKKKNMLRWLSSTYNSSLHSTTVWLQHLDSHETPGEKLVRPCVVAHKRTSLMISSLFSKRGQSWFLYLIWFDCVMGGN